MVTNKSPQDVPEPLRNLYLQDLQKGGIYGYRIMKVEGYKTLIADREKALADYIYFRLRDGETDFSHERFDLSKVRKRKTAGYARLYNRKTLKTVEELLK